MLIQCNQVDFSFQSTPLLKNLNFIINHRQRVGLVGRNGAGKSTLLQLLLHQLEPDRGTIVIKDGCSIGCMPQKIPPLDNQSLYDFISDHISASVKNDDHAIAYKIKSILDQFKLDPHARTDTLSGGMTRRLLLARALVVSPDILILDEPTNHLDIETIEQLETALRQFKKTLLFVSHDRDFMRNIATDILEIDRGEVTLWQGNYDRYLNDKQKALEEEQAQQKIFDKKLAQEEAFARQGIKARRTRNEGRMRHLKKMREERRARVLQTGTMGLKKNDAIASGKQVIVADNISFSYENKKIINNFSTTILRGDKIGIIGPNGIGKTTLIHLLLKKIEPSQGIIAHGTKLHTQFFDQTKQQLDLEKTAYDFVFDGSEHRTINGKPMHVMRYLQDFLFAPERIRIPIKVLSGGEQHRLLLAKLLSQPSNLLILDEPTNDLDLEALEQLEQYLVDYQGTVLLISHDRAFINNVVTSTLIFENSGTLTEYVGGYDQWQQQQNKSAPPPKKTNTNKKENTSTTTIRSSKLSNKEREELANLPEKIEQTEQKIAALSETMSKTDFYQQPADIIRQTSETIKTLEKQLESDFQRFTELDDKLNQTLSG